MTSFTLAAITASVVAGCTVLVILIGVLIDRSAAKHELRGGK